MLLSNGQWPLIVALLFLLRASQVRSYLQPFLNGAYRATLMAGRLGFQGIVAGAHWLGIAGRRGWRGGLAVGRWLAPYAKRLFQAGVVQWGNVPRKYKDGLLVALLIGLLILINTWGSAPAAPSPAPTSPLIVSPLAPPTRVGE